MVGSSAPFPTIERASHPPGHEVAMLAGLMNWIATTPFLAAVYVIAAVGAFVVLSLWIRYIPNTRVGIVEKLISGKGSVRSGLIALHGEAGFQPEVLRGGWHLLTPFQYRVHRMPLVTI